MKRRVPFTIGLTGSIGMGKSTTAETFRDEGIAVWDADSAVHRLYEKGGAAVPEIAKLWPEAIKDQSVDRAALKKWIAKEPKALERIEQVVHPLVASDRQNFLRDAKGDIVILDIPLLFEAGTKQEFDMIVVVSAPPDIQRTRVLARPGMTEDQLTLILSRQLPDSEKRARADVVIPTIKLEETRTAVQNLLARIREDQQYA